MGGYVEGTGGDGGGGDDVVWSSRTDGDSMEPQTGQGFGSWSWLQKCQCHIQWESEG